jgi:hypothetical protein
VNEGTEFMREVGVGGKLLAPNWAGVWENKRGKRKFSVEGRKNIYCKFDGKKIGGNRTGGLQAGIISNYIH